ncbi:MAG: hypothetical protein HY722_11985 [Planctomycetes bacterium]|nr:hypothetical protein [Planctomycetota bacterium]
MDPGLRVRAKLRWWRSLRPRREVRRGLVLALWASATALLALELSVAALRLTGLSGGAG